MNIDCRNVVYQESNNASALYAPTWGVMGSWMSIQLVKVAIKHRVYKALKAVERNIVKIFL